MNPVKLAVLALLAAVVATPATQAAPKADASTLSTAVTDKVVDAIAEELERSMAELNLGGVRPYFISYKLTEVEVNDVSASLGATVSSKERHFLSLEANVHVGSYAEDNSNFAIPQAAGFDGVATVQLPLEPNPTIARRAAWLATDTAYREAMIQLAAKRDFRKSGGSTSAGVPSYTKAAPLVQDKPVLVPALEHNRDLERRARDISRVFGDQKHIRDSRVAFTSFLERRWYMNSEGTSAHDTRRVSGVVIAATSQASDGQELADYFTHYGTTARYLPSDKELVAEAKKVATTLDALRKAPVMDNYTGPILFEGEGATGVVRFSLAPHLGGTPVPEGLEASQAKQFGGAISDRIGKGKVLSSMLGLIDDPTARKVGKRALIGGYRFDDEGVPAQRVEVIKRGRLVTLLMGRTPSKDIAKSNGHARRLAPGGGFHGSATNLFVTTRKGLSRRQLVKKLIAAVKDEGLPYGLIIRQFDDAAITAAPERTRRELLALINTTDTDAPPPVLLAYRVYPSGKEELVRGVHLKPIEIRAWKDIIATGKKMTVKNLLASGQHNLIHLLRGVGQGFVPSSGVESGIVTPDLLFGELGVIGSSSGRRTAPAIPRP